MFLVMWQRRTIFIVLIFSIVISWNIAQPSSTRRFPRLLIVSLDGFRHDYLNKYTLPTLNRFRNDGVQTTHGMRPCYVTMTFPNHMSLATGMYEEDHGIIHNTFFDRRLNKTISIGSYDEGQFADPKVEPLWITATKQGKKAATEYWPACINEFHGWYPFISNCIYSDAIPFRVKIDNAVSYFRQNSVQLVMLYHYEPDRQGHIYGPDSSEVYEALVRLDHDIDYLLSKVKNELDDDLDIIIVSDHGMTNVRQVIYPFVEGYINPSMVEPQVLSGPYFNVIPRPGQLDQVINGLRGIPNVTIYMRDQMPKRFHYSKPIHRLGEVFVIPNEEGVRFQQSTIFEPFLQKGNHGWDNTLLSMQAIFLARGPSFSQQVQIRSLNNVDIYHIACRILELTPNPYATAGSLANLTSIFRLPSELINGCSLPLIDFVLLLFSFVFCSTIQNRIG